MALETPEYSTRQPDSNGILEQPCDLENEVMVKERIEEKANWVLIKQQTLDPMDYLATKVKPKGMTETIALIEMRKRTINHDTFAEGVFFNKDKFDKLCRVASALWIPAYLFLTFDDGLFWVDLTKVIRPKLARGDRGDPDYKRATDNDPVVLLPIDRLKEF